MKRHELALTAGLLLALIITPIADFAKSCDSTTDKVLRLHILANSDSGYDQSLKYLVRDEIIKETASDFSGEMSLEQMEQTAAQSLNKIEEIANRTLQQKGSTQHATAKMTKLHFGTRSYNGIIFPAGSYEAVQVVLGDGRGKNWWCVMYPPMCLPAAAKEQNTQQEILNLQEKPRYKMAFATVEFAQKLREKFLKENPPPTQEESTIPDTAHQKNPVDF